MSPRLAEIVRKTRETEVRARVCLDGGPIVVHVPNGFFAHMLEALAKHSGLGLEIDAEGDTHIDLHHTVEDVGIVLGECLRKALGEARGVVRFGQAHAPLDEALARAVVDISGRGFLDFTLGKELGASWVTSEFPMTLLHDFFLAFADRGRITLHLDVLKGRNPHHAAEASFKAVAVALRQALAERPGVDEVPSTKGTLIS